MKTMKKLLKKARKSRKRRQMKGGYSTAENVILNNYGLSEGQIQHLEDLGVSFARIIEKTQEIDGRFEYGFNGNSDDYADMVVEELQNEAMGNETLIPGGVEGVEEDDNGSLHLSDLDQSIGDTDVEEGSDMDGGHRRRRKTSKKRRSRRKASRQRRRKTRKN